MKLYNPFRWHVYRLDKTYYVRKLSLFYAGWVYADTDKYFWGSMRYVYKYCKIYELDKALDLASTLRKRMEFIA